VDEQRLVKISKYLSKHLRHEPERLGLTLASGGWVEVDTLLTAMARHNFVVTRAELDEVVVKNDKQRFSFDPTGTQIRANQGHSVAVDLELEPTVPPDILYHGTGEKSVRTILEHGLKKMSRQHVHLSRDYDTAVKVGARHGKPIVFLVQAAAMHTAGHIFFVSDNGVWLVESVPPQFLSRV
jgi:putative RNA 2'-phosphotransferase